MLSIDYKSAELCMCGIYLLFIYILLHSPKARFDRLSRFYSCQSDVETPYACLRFLLSIAVVPRVNLGRLLPMANPRTRPPLTAHHRLDLNK